MGEGPVSARGGDVLRKEEGKIRDTNGHREDAGQRGSALLTKNALGLSS